MTKRFAFTASILVYLSLMTFKINEVRLFVYDEVLYAHSVQTLIYNLLDANNHPLLIKTIWLIFVKLGWIITGYDQPAFWRIGTILMSLGCLAIFYKILRLFFTDTIAQMGVVILAFDPLFYVFGRTMHLEIPSLMFFLLAIYSLLIFQMQNKIRYLYLSAVTLGLTIASKISPLIVFSALQISSALDIGKNLKTVKAIVIILLLSGFAYVFGNAYYFVLTNRTDFIDYNTGLIVSFLTGKASAEQLKTISTSSPITWYLIPQAIRGYNKTLADGVSYVIAFQNPLTMILVFPTLIILFANWKRLSLSQKTIFYVFVIVYGIYFLNVRERYYYYVIQLLPFVILLELFALGILVTNKKLLSKILKLTVCFSLLVFTVSFPALTGIPEPKVYSSKLLHLFIYHPNPHSTLFCEAC